MMTIKRTSKLWPKVIRNMIRLNRLNNYGWQCFGMLFANNNPEFWIKRSNWIYNFTNHGVTFKGTI